MPMTVVLMAKYSGEESPWQQQCRVLNHGGVRDYLHPQHSLSFLFTRVYDTLCSNSDVNNVLRVRVRVRVCVQSSERVIA